MCVISAPVREVLQRGVQDLLDPGLLWTSVPHAASSDLWACLDRHEDFERILHSCLVIPTTEMSVCKWRMRAYFEDEDGFRFMLLLKHQVQPMTLVVRPVSLLVVFAFAHPFGASSTPSKYTVSWKLGSFPSWHACRAIARQGLGMLGAGRRQWGLAGQGRFGWWVLCGCGSCLLKLSTVILNFFLSLVGLPC